MIQGFIIENQTSKQRVTLGMNPKYDYVYKDDGLDWGYAPASHSTYSYPGQVGEKISMTNIQGRDISFTGYVHYLPSKVDVSNYSREGLQILVRDKIEEKKGVLNSLINPMDHLRIIVGDFYLEGKPNRSIQYGQTVSENNEYFCMFEISIYCENPMFHKVKSPNTVIAGSSPGFHFPLSIPDTGYFISTRIDYLIISCENEGNATVGGVITITAQGTVKNPVIENIETGEKFTIYKTLSEGEVVEINTTQGENRGIKGGVDGATQNYFRYWDYENDWIEFGVGNTMVGYTADDDTQVNMTVKVVIAPEKYGLEDQ